MHNFLRVSSGLNVLPLQLELHRQPQLFGQYVERKDNPASPHRDMDDIWVRYNDRRPFDASGNWAAFNDEHDSVWYPVANEIPSARVLALDILALTRGERLGAVLITKLPPGGEIKSHIDGGWHAEYYDKYFLAVRNPPGAVFGFAEGDINPMDGDLHWFRNSVPHWVKNNSNEDRIAMIVCVRHDKRNW